MKKSSKLERKIRRQKRVRAKASGTAQRPRLSVFRSNRHIYAQLIDDAAAKTLAQFNDFAAAGQRVKTAGSKTDSAKKVGQSLGGLILKKGFTSVVFDRSGYKYHGRVKALADGLRSAGVKF